MWGKVFFFNLCILLQTLLELCTPVISQQDGVWFPMEHGACKYEFIKGLAIASCRSQIGIPHFTSPPPKFTELRMSNRSNLIEVIPNHQILKAGLLSVKILGLEDCGIKEIEAEAFKDGNNVIALYLGNNLLKTLNSAVFQYLPNLEFLRLNGNPLRVLDSSAVFPRLKLSWIYLHNCELCFIQSDVFQNLENLEVLSLNKNELAHLNWETFKPLKTLKLLSLDDNPWHCDCWIGRLRLFLGEKKVAFDAPTCASFPIKTSSKVVERWSGKTWNGIAGVPDYAMRASGNNCTVYPWNNSHISCLHVTTQMIVAMGIVLVMTGIIIISSCVLLCVYCKRKPRKMKVPLSEMKKGKIIVETTTKTTKLSEIKICMDLQDRNPVEPNHYSECPGEMSTVKQDYIVEYPDDRIVVRERKLSEAIEVNFPSPTMENLVNALTEGEKTDTVRDDEEDVIFRPYRRNSVSAWSVI